MRLCTLVGFDIVSNCSMDGRGSFKTATNTCQMHYATLKSYKVREFVQFLLLCLLCYYMDVFACKPQFLLTFCGVIRLHVEANVELAYLTVLVYPQEKVLRKNAVRYVTVLEYIFL